jgi:ribose transport system permease protein
MIGQRISLLIAWAAVIVIFAIAEPDSFFTWSTFAIIFGSQAVLVVLTLALLVPLTTSDYDLSAASVLTLSSMIIAVLTVNHGWALGPAIVVALAAGIAVGVVNGAVIVLFGIESLIVTLGTGTVVAGITLWISDSATISGIPSGLVDWVIGNRLLGIPIEFYYGILLAAVIWYLFEFTPLGKRMLFVGRGRSVARLSGINVSRVRWGAVIASGFLAAGAGVLYAGTNGAADPSSGAAFLLPAFAAAFLGATSITPGRFNPWGSVAAVYFLVTGITGLQLAGVENFVQQLFYGGALVIAVVLSEIARRRSGAVTRSE